MLQGGYAHCAEGTDLTSVEWLKDVDAITVATAPMSHYSIIRQALELGKHVLTEKPFTMTVAEGEELVELAKASDLRLAIVHNFQFARSTKQLLREISQGLFGVVRAINAVQFGNPGRRLPLWYDQLPLGLMYDESPHLLYLIRAVGGEIQLVRSLTYPSSTGLNTPARVDAFFSSPTFHGPITLSCNFESPVSEWYMMVFGENRLGVVDVFRDIYISLPNDGAHQTSKVFRTSLYSMGQHLWQHVVSGIPHLRGRLFYGNDDVFARFAGAIRGAVEVLAPIGPTSALAVLRLQHQIIDRQERWGNNSG
jgi:predicted dehydrogenase